MTLGSPVQPGDIIADKYKVERILGAGGMGVVIVARHLQLDQAVAIKFLLPAVAKSPEAVARFAREARAAAKIQSEHVARVLDVATGDNDAPYMVMEYLEGKDLETILEDQGRLPIDNALDYVLQALEALAEAHAAGIVHRDLKPANIFLARRADGSSVVKVLDFGISKLSRGSDPQITTTSAQMGSPLYMSPEQLRRTRDVDARADIWSLGVILHELLVGEAPFMADSLPEVIAMILSEPPLSMRLRRPEVPGALEAVVRKCLEKVPEDRYADVAELARALQPFAPERSAVSVERVTRVVAGRQETSLHIDLRKPTPREIHVSHTLGTESSWQTGADLKPRHASRWRLVAPLAAMVGGVGMAVALLVARRGPAESATSPPSSPQPVEIVSTAAASPMPSSSTAQPAGPADSAAPAAGSIAVIVQPRGKPGSNPSRPTGPVPLASVQAPVMAAPASGAPALSPKPAKTSTSDFGGRK